MLICLGLPTLRRSAATYIIAGSLEALSLTGSPCREMILTKYFFLSAPFAVQFVAHIQLLSEYICAH